MAEGKTMKMRSDKKKSNTFWDTLRERNTSMHIIVQVFNRDGSPMKLQKQQIKIVMASTSASKTLTTLEKMLEDEDKDGE